MKARQARRIEARLARGEAVNFQQVQDAAQTLQRPLMFDISNSMGYCPKHILGKWYRAYKNGKVKLIPKNQRRIHYEAGWNVSNYEERLNVGWNCSASAGDSIDCFAPRAEKFSRLIGRRIEFDFNDQHLVCRPNTVPGDTYKLWRRTFDEQCAAYQKSERKEEYDANHAEEVARRQVNVDRVVKELFAFRDEWASRSSVDDGDDFLQANYGRLLDLCYQYSENTDYNGVVFHGEEVATTLKKMGFFAGENCYESSDEKRDESNPVFLRQFNKVQNARYIIGQVISGCESSVGCPHPMAMTFIERWRDMSDDDAVNLKAYRDKQLHEELVDFLYGVYRQLRAEHQFDDDFSNEENKYEEWPDFDEMNLDQLIEKAKELELAA